MRPRNLPGDFKDQLAADRLDETIGAVGGDDEGPGAADKLVAVDLGQGVALPLIEDRKAVDRDPGGQNRSAGLGDPCPAEVAQVTCPPEVPSL